MSGLLRRLTRRRSATADETRSPTSESSEPAGATAETPAEPGGGQPVPAPDEQATNVLPATADHPVVADPQPAPAQMRDLPAGIDPAELAVAPAASAQRGKLRRRLRYLREVRELLLRDLGGFVFEIHRTAGGTAQAPQRRLVEAKANRIAAVDAEVRGLEARLGEPHEAALLREPGIGGLCPECGELHASDAHYCSRCGAPLDAKSRAKRDAAIAAAARPASEPAPASILWAGGPRPRANEPADEEQTDPSAVTSEWLALPQHESSATKDDAAPAGDDHAAAGDETAAPSDEPVTTGDETAAPSDEPMTTGDETAAADDETGAAGDENAPAADEPASGNGRRDEDVPPPVSSRDPLTSRPKQGS
jgi:hypothetical protein